MVRGEASPESGMSGTVVTVADSDALGYLAEKGKAGCVGCPPARAGPDRACSRLQDASHTCGREVEAARLARLGVW